MIWMIIGLGNPGSEYEQTRHNVGYRVVDELANRWGGLLLVKPTTYMNRSGLAWLEMVERYEVTAGEAVIICDDLNLPFGRIRIRTKGSDGGHNGLASILEAAGCEEVPRMRIGIGQPEDDHVDYVLSPFGEQEQVQVERIISTAADAAETIVDESIVRAMDQFNNVQIVSE